MNKTNIIALVGVWLSCAFAIFAQEADLIVFSYDRPLQLYAFLESLHNYATGVGDIYVVYRVSDERYQAAYDIVQKTFAQTVFLKQGNFPKVDFKPLMLKALADSSHEYLLFAVDDIILKDYVDISYCIDLLESTNAYGFYLKMGTNLNYCYTMNQVQKLPPLLDIAPDVYAWKFDNASCDWNYAHTVDMTLYRKAQVQASIRNLSFDNPNSFECAWAWLVCCGATRNCYGLCFSTSKVINTPLNCVQDTFANRHMQNWSTLALLELFEQGKKIDISGVHQMQNTAVHTEYMPEFIPRA